MNTKPSLYNILGAIKCIDSLTDKVKHITQGEWLAWEDRKVFATQKDSNSIPIFNLPDRGNKVFNNKIYNVEINKLLEKELQECYNRIDKYYPGDQKRVLLVSLPAGCNVEEHTDSGYHLETSHRIHVPIITNDEVLFFCNNIQVPMVAGSIVDFNNNARHKVINKSSQDRIHLIIDWGKKNDPYYF
jgi:hypothetical protein